jgi:two-component system cell cycle sensor histidine kinase PleC
VGPGARQTETEAISAQADALSPRRLMLMTGMLAALIALLFIGKIREEDTQRRLETALLLDRAAGECAAAANIAVMTGDAVAAALKQCRPEGRVSLYHLAADGGVIGSSRIEGSPRVSAAEIAALTLDKRGAMTLGSDGEATRLVWRPLDNGEAVLAAGPEHDLFGRTPAWFFYLLILTAFSLGLASLMAAFLRQSRAAAIAAGAVSEMQTIAEAMSAGSAGVWRFDGKDRTLHLSKSILEAAGLGARDRVFTMREITAIAHPDDLRNALAAITGDTSGVSEAVVRLRQPSGGWARIHFRTGADATRFRRVGVAVDLSGARALGPGERVADSRLKDAIENIPEAFVLWDHQGRLAAANRRFAAIFRIDAKALTPGLAASEVVALARSASETLERFFTPAAATGEQSVEVELPKDRWLHISRRATSEGGLVCLASNVTDMKRRARAQTKKERELQATVSDLETSRRELSATMRNYESEKARAEEASRSKSEFLANMSHELRTPLNAINGFSEIMHSELYGPLGDDKYKEYVGDILASGQHLLELIDDILDMSRIEAGKYALEPKRVEIERVLEECARLVSKRARDSNVKLTTSVAHAPAVFADARAVKQVALNLLSNAVKFTPAGGEVTLTAEADLDGVTVIVADNGVGIARENLSRLGAPFEMLDEHLAKAQRGAGLGLSLSKALMELQGGLLALASQPGRGTVACATFPRRRDARVRLPSFIRGEAHILTGETDRGGPQGKAASQAAE